MNIKKNIYEYFNIIVKNKNLTFKLAYIHKF